MKNTFVLSFIVFLIFQTSIYQLIAQDVDEGKLYALIIGVSDYSKSEHLPNLPNVQHDIDSLQKVLTQKYNAETIVLNNSHSTKSDIFDKFYDLSRKLKEKDKLIVYYSGHGIYDENFKTGYWMTYNVRDDKDFANALSYREIINFIDRIESKHVLLIADACYSGAVFVSKGVENSNLEQQMMYKSRYAITSGGLTKVSDGSFNDHHSPFAEALIEILKNNKYKYLSSKNIGDYIQNIFYAKPKSVGEMYQIPQQGKIKGDMLGMFTLFYEEGIENVFKSNVNELINNNETINPYKTTELTKNLSKVAINMEMPISFYSGKNAGTFKSIAEDIINTLDDYSFILEKTPGSYYNAKHISESKTFEMALSQIDLISEFNSVQPVLHLYESEMHFIVLKSSDINTIEDTFGKRIAAGDPDYGRYYTAKSINKDLNLNWEFVEGNINTAFENLLARKVDVVFFLAGVPTKYFGVIDENAKKYIKLISPKSEILEEKYAKGNISDQDYSWVTGDIQTYVVANAIIVNKRYLEDEKSKKLINHFVNELIENEPILRKYGHPKWKNFIEINTKYSK